MGAKVIMASIDKSEIDSLKSDLVVVGGGGSGLVAAVSAAEHGVKNIVVLEKSSRPGGNTYIGAVGMMAVESPAQKRLGIRSSKDQVFKEAMEYARWTVNPSVVRAYIEKSGQIIDWLEGKGIRLEVVQTDPRHQISLGHKFLERQGGHKGSDPTCGPGWVGSTVVEEMLKECKTLGINIITKTRAKKLLTNDTGEIIGILAIGENGEVNISTKSVIIAAGGFGGNKAWMEKYFHIKGDICRNSLGTMTGDGISLAAEVGAFNENGLGFIAFGPCHHPWAYSIHRLIGRPEMIYINTNGKRFMDESSGNGLGAITRQPGQICYALIDRATIDKIKRGTDFSPVLSKEHNWRVSLERDIEKETAEGKKSWKADTIDQLGRMLGIQSDILKDTIERYNSFCESGYDADFIKDSKFLKSLSVSPFYAFLGRRGYDTTHGGIDVNEHMEALNKQGNVVKGLYAAGDNAGDWVSSNYSHGGTSTTWAFCSGYIAGQSAAKYISVRDI